MQDKLKRMMALSISSLAWYRKIKIAVPWFTRSLMDRIGSPGLTPLIIKSRPKKSLQNLLQQWKIRSLPYQETRWLSICQTRSTWVEVRYTLQLSDSTLWTEQGSENTAFGRWKTWKILRRKCFSIFTKRGINLSWASGCAPSYALLRPVATRKLNAFTS